MSRWPKLTGEEWISSVLMALVALADLVISGAVGANLASDSAVLSCDGGDGPGVTCTVAEDSWVRNRTRVYHHVTRAVVTSVDEDGGPTYFVRLAGESGGIGPSSLTRGFNHQGPADRYAAHLTDLIAGSFEQSFSVEVRARCSPWAMAIALPLFTIVIGIAVTMVSGLLLVLLGFLVRPLATLILPPCRAADRAYRRLDAWYVGVVAARAVRRMLGEVERSGAGRGWLERRVQRLPSRARTELGRQLAADRRTPAILLEVAVQCCLGDGLVDQVPIAFHPNVSAELLEQMLAGPVAALVAAHPAAPVELLADLVLDERKAVRRAAIANPNATAEVKALAWLAN